MAGKIRSAYLRGFKDGLPTGLGYLSVSFGFGILAVNLGLSVAAAVGISATNLTSAGQVAGVRIIAAGGTLAEIVMALFVINLRYALMGVSLTQKLAPGYTLGHRILSSFFLTDEIFAVASANQEPVTPAYMYGLGTLPFIGWSLGTLLGAAAGEILPPLVTAALGIAIYGMFVAIVVPPMKVDRGVLLAVTIAILLSCAIYYLPFLSFIPDGIAMIVCALVSSCIVAALRPVREVEE
ncbi:MAG: AzlC family ABC transporter permease [Clostridia bacterium]|nr:AzlC family ABC transporter permease [Clostridia bacterium]